MTAAATPGLAPAAPASLAAARRSRSVPTCISSALLGSRPVAPLLSRRARSTASAQKRTSGQRNSGVGYSNRSAALCKWEKPTGAGIGIIVMERQSDLNLHAISHPFCGLCLDENLLGGRLCRQ
eukprot:scaffold389165_cov25-Prasinocladus_malaysianus.AAC.2